jgi:TetR/AcrR family transcriptional regulator, fatty acid metabolism regulator protein
MDINALNSRQIQAINTKNKIYDSAIKLINSKDYNNIKIEDICKDAGVSIGCFYKYFKSKNHILIEMYKRGDDYFRTEVEKNLVSPTAPEKILEYFNYYAKYNIITGIDITKQLYKADNKLFIAKDRYMQILLKIIIKSGQDNDELLKDMMPDEITEYLFIAARGVVYNWCLYDGIFSLEEAMSKYMKRIIDTFVNKDIINKF